MSPQATTFPTTSLRESIRVYNPFHSEERIPLEATVERYYQKVIPTSLFESKPYLILKLRGPDSVLRYSQYYSPLELDLSLPLVREISDLLTSGKTAKFRGELILDKRWFLPLLLLPIPARSTIGELIGELRLDGKAYSVRFISAPREEMYPYLADISPK